MRLCFFLLLLLSLGFASGLSGQAKSQTLDLKKGQAFDIILLTNAEDNKEDMADYFNRASPILMGTSPGGLLQEAVLKLAAALNLAFQPFSAPAAAPCFTPFSPAET